MNAGKRLTDKNRSVQKLFEFAIYSNLQLIQQKWQKKTEARESSKMMMIMIVLEPFV